MKYCYLQLGSNIGNRKEFIEKALLYISKQIGNLIITSDIYETAPWGNTNQKDFLNLVVKVQTKWSAIEILLLTKRIEVQLNRIKKEHWGPRTIDIDILFYGYDIINTENLIIPHPLIENRRFVLQPMSDIAGGFIHPVKRKKIKTLLVQCKDNSEVKKLNE